MEAVLAVLTAGSPEYSMQLHSSFSADADAQAVPPSLIIHISHQNFLSLETFVKLMGGMVEVVHQTKLAWESVTVNPSARSRSVIH